MNIKKILICLLTLSFGLQAVELQDELYITKEGKKFPLPPQVVDVLHLQQEARVKAVDYYAQQLHTQKGPYSVTFKPLPEPIKLVSSYSEICLSKASITVLKDEAGNFTLDIQKQNTQPDPLRQVEGLVFKTEEHTKEELKAVQKLFNTVFKKSGYEHTFKYYKERPESNYNALCGTVLLTAQQEDKIKGFAVVAKDDDEQLEINYIGVDPTQQKTGIGSAMIQYLMSRFVPKTIALSAENQAVPFYEKNGFIEDKDDPFKHSDYTGMTKSITGYVFEDVKKSNLQQIEWDDI